MSVAMLCENASVYSTVCEEREEVSDESVHIVHTKIIAKINNITIADSC